MPKGVDDQYVAIYARVSGQDQADTGSIQTQIEHLERYCAAMGWTIVERYTDEPISGTTKVEDRPDGGRLLRDAANPKRRWTKLLVYKLDRLARSVLILHTTLAQLEAQEIGLVSATESFDTATPYGRMMVGLLAVFAQWERDLISDRSLGGRDRVSREGKLCGVPPLGFKTADSFLVVDEEPIPGCQFSEADLIRRIFRLLVEDGLSVYAIAERLNAEKVPTPQACNYPRRKNQKTLAEYWRHTTIQGILHNPIYRGEYVYGKKRQQPIRVPVAAIVSPAVWEGAQRRLHENRKSPAGNTYLLTSRIRCGICGNAYTGVTHRGKYAYYVCAARNSPRTYFGPNAAPCPAPRLKVEPLETQVWDDIVRFAHHPEEALTTLTEDLNRRRENSDAIQEQVDHLTSLLKAAADQRDRVLRLYVRAQVSEVQKDELLQEIEAEKTKQEEDRARKLLRLESFQRQEEQLATATALLARMRDYLTGRTLTPEQQQRLVQKAVRELVVQEGEDGWEVKAEYVFSPPEGDCGAAVQRDGVATGSPAA